MGYQGQCATGLQVSLTHSLTHGVGRHFVIVEGHRLFECDTLLNDADYIVILTALPSTLRCRPEPTEEQSLQLYINRVQPHLQALNESKGIMKINGISTPDTVIKKVGAFIALKNKGFQNCGKRLSDTRSLLEVSTSMERIFFISPRSILLHHALIVPTHDRDKTYYALRIAFFFVVLSLGYFVFRKPDQDSFPLFKFMAQLCFQVRFQI